MTSQTQLMQTARSESIAKVALLFILGSESVFFGMLVSAYFFLRTSQPTWTSIPLTIQRLWLPGANTLLLLVSALTVFLGNQSIRKANSQNLVRWLTVTVLLGLVFIGGQIFEFTRNGMSPSDHTSGGIFFTLMGFHALHVAAGMIVLGLVWMRARLGDFSLRKHLAVDMGTYFWWYVTAIWVVLFAILYLV